MTITLEMFVNTHHCRLCQDVSMISSKYKSDEEILECIVDISTIHKYRFRIYCHEIFHNRRHLKDQNDNIQRLLFNPER